MAIHTTPRMKLFPEMRVPPAVGAVTVPLVTEDVLLVRVLELEELGRLVDEVDEVERLVDEVLDLTVDDVLLVVAADPCRH